MSLSEHQREFARHVGWLLFRIYATGYSCTFGDAYRDPRAFGEMGEPAVYGRWRSAHKQRLAVDLNLFSPDGRYLRDTEDYRQFGLYWERLAPENVWGGHFGQSDGNHFSRRYNDIA